MAESRVESTVTRLLDSVISGDVEPGATLPSEAVLAQQLNVSRLTLREAVRILTDRGVLRPVHGRGTFVNPRQKWTDLGSIIALESRTSNPRDIALDLVEVRRMVEVGAAGLAAGRRSDEDIEAMGRILGQFQDAHMADDVEATVRADLAFHDRILQAARNPFLNTVFDPLLGTLHAGRAKTSAHRTVREHATAHHTAILEAIRAADADAARTAMNAHMDQTAADITTYVRPR